MKYNAAIVTRFPSEPTCTECKTRVGRHGQHGQGPRIIKRTPEITVCKVGSGRVLGVKKTPVSPPSRQITPENNLNFLPTHIVSARQHRGKVFGIRILQTRWNEVMVEQATQGCQEGNDFTSSCHQNCSTPFECQPPPQ